MIQYKVNSWHLRLARSTMGSPNYMPGSLCPHFWVVLFSIISYLFFLPTHIIHFFSKRYYKFLPMFNALGFLAFIKGARGQWVWLAWYCGIYGVLMLLLYALSKGWLGWPALPEIKGKGMLFDGLRSFFGRYCPQVTWVDTNGDKVLTHAERSAKEKQIMDLMMQITDAALTINPTATLELIGRYSVNGVLSVNDDNYKQYFTELSAIAHTSEHEPLPPA